MNPGRIEARFAALEQEGRAALITFTMAGDPDPATAATIAIGLPGAGADLIEIGMPFSDPMADGPTIQRAGQRALAAGQTMAGTLGLVREIRAADERVPIVLMGYFNPILAYGIESFVRNAAGAGADGVIVVDLPPEEDEGFRLSAAEAGLRLIRLATPTTDARRLPTVIAGSSGFVYYVSITGITGAAAPNSDEVAATVARVKRVTNLPVCVGFGVRSPGAAAEIARGGADGVVVGSAIVQRIGENVPPAGIHEFVSGLAAGVSTARNSA